MPTILIVEDDPATAHATELALRQHGYEVELAEDGVAGYAAAARARPAAIVTDWLMPHADGAALCGMLLADPQLRDTPIVVHSSVPSPPTPDNPVVRYCRKPCAPDQLVSLIEEAMAEAKRRAGSAS